MEKYARLYGNSDPCVPSYGGGETADGDGELVNWNVKGIIHIASICTALELVSSET